MTSELRPFNVVPTRTGTTIQPHPHQQRVIEALRAAYDAEGDRTVGVVVMPTGAGKTVTAVNWLLDHPVRQGAKVLWVTHRRELLRQTAGTFVHCAPLLAEDRARLTVRLIGGGFGGATTSRSRSAIRRFKTPKPRPVPPAGRAADTIAAALRRRP